MSSGTPPNAPRTPEQEQFNRHAARIFLDLLEQEQRYGPTFMTGLRAHCQTNNLDAPDIGILLTQRSDTSKLEEGDAQRMLTEAFRQADELLRQEIRRRQEAEAATAEALARSNRVGCLAGGFRGVFGRIFWVPNKVARIVRSLNDQGPWKTTVVPAETQEAILKLRFGMSSRTLGEEEENMPRDQIQAAAILSAQDKIKSEVEYPTLPPDKQKAQDAELKMMADVMRLFNDAADKIEHCARAVEHAHSFLPSGIEDKTDLTEVGESFEEMHVAIEKFVTLGSTCVTNTKAAAAIVNTKSECKILLNRAKALESALKAFTSGSWGKTPVVLETWAERAGTAWDTSAQWLLNTNAFNRQTTMVHLLGEMKELREVLATLDKLMLVDNDPKEIKKSITDALDKHAKEKQKQHASATMQVLASITRGVRENLLKLSLIVGVLYSGTTVVNYFQSDEEESKAVPTQGEVPTRVQKTSENSGSTIDLNKKLQEQLKKQKEREGGN